MTNETKRRPTAQQIREESRNRCYNAYLSVCKAHSEHTQLLQKLSDKRPNDAQAKRKSQNAINYHQRITEETKSIKIDSETSDKLSPTVNSNLTKSEPTKEASRATLGSHLPIELNFEIVEQIISSDPSPENQQTLKSLCETSSEFRAIAEPYLWKDIGDLDTLEKQWRFRYAVAIHPELGEKVKKAHLFWQSGGANGKLLKELCSSCPNLQELLIQRGGIPGEPASLDDFDIFEQTDSMQLFDILKSLKNLKTFTWAFYVPPPNILTNSSNAEATLSPADPSDAKDSFSTLTNLDLRGWTTSFLNAIVYNLTDKVESIRFGSEIEVDHELLNSIASKCISLRELELRYMGGVYAIDLIDFARHSSSLESLNIMQVNQDGQEDWFANVLSQAWKNLKSLNFGTNWTVPHSTFFALSLSHSPSLEVLKIWDIDDEVKEDIVVKMLERQVSSLKECSIGGRGFFTGGKETLKVLQNAKQLNKLSLPALTKDVEAKDVDILLQTCPRLWKISDVLKNISNEEKVWESRESKGSPSSESDWAYARLGT